MHNHNRQVWQRAIVLGMATRADLERVAGAESPDGVDEDLAELLLQDGLINDEQKALLAGAQDFAQTLPLDQETTLLQQPAADLEKTHFHSDQPVADINNEQTQLLAPPAQPSGDALANAETLVQFSDAGQIELQELTETLPDEVSQQNTSDLIGFELHAAKTTVDSPRKDNSGGSDSDSGSISTADEISRARKMTGHDRERMRKYRQGAPDSLLNVNLNGYRIVGRLGTGGMGDVYEAVQLSLNRKVALKILPMSLASDQSFINRFYREARTLASFTHANIVQVYDVGETEGLHFFTMEEVHGKSFKDLITEEGTPVAILTNLMKQCLRGLGRAQKAGVIHRDIKPGNLLISDQGDVKIVDFGLAETVADSGEFHSASVVGTPLYIAPEQVTSEPQTFRTDMYSLGATFYHLCTGKPPYLGKTAMQTGQMHVEEPVPDASDLNSSVPRGFAEILKKMMAKNPADRYASYKDLFDALEAFELQTGIIKTRSDFLADSLMAIGDHSIRGIWNKIAFMTVVGAALTILAIGLHTVLEKQGLHPWIARAGDIGTALFAMAILFIAYVAMARKKIVPIIGRIQTWMYAHIVCAIISYFLVTIHSGNFFRYFLGGGTIMHQYPDRIVFDKIPLIAFLNSFVFMIVIISGLVGATIWRDVLKQVTVERIRQGQEPEKADSKLTMSIFSQNVFKYWRIIHYPLAVALTLLTILHVVSILYYRGI